MPIIIPKDLLPETDKSFPIPDQGFEDRSISNDNRYVAYLDCFWMAVWNIKTRECLWKQDSMDYRSENNYYVEVTPDNKYVVSAGDKITLRDIQSGEIIWSVENPYGTAAALKLSSDGKNIVTACANICIFDLASGKLMKTIFMSEDDEEYTEDFSNIAISHNNIYIAAILGLGGIVVWNQSGDIVYVLREDNFDLDSSYIGLELEFSPDDTYLAAIKPDMKTIDIWEMSTGNLINTLHYDSKMWSIKFIQQTNTLLTNTNNGNKIIWNYLEMSNEFKYSNETNLTIQTELISENIKFKDQIFIQIKVFIDKHIRHFFENPTNKTIKKLEILLPEFTKGWPEEYIPYVIEEYKRAINYYGKLKASKWKKWSKLLFKLIPLIR